MNSLSEMDQTTVAELAINYPGALSVFTKYDIDYCCGGNRTLTEACHRIGLAPETIARELRNAKGDTSMETYHYDQWTSALLINVIVENHHAFVRRIIPQLQTLLDKVCERHGTDSGELLRIRECFHALSDELTSHMEKEELVLFPTMKELEAEQAKNSVVSRVVQAPIAVMEDEHEVAGDLIKQIRTLSNNYTPPDFACPTFQITYQLLKEFDNDLMRHIHLENNILFKRFKVNTSASSCVL